MRVKLIVDAARPMGWQGELAARLASAGHLVTRSAVSGAPAWPAAVTLLLELEGLIYASADRRLADRVTPPAGEPATACDLTIDLSGRPAIDDDALRPLYDASPESTAAIAALLDGRAPRLAIARGRETLEEGLPALENPALVSVGLDAVFARVADLCARAVARHTHGIEWRTGAVTPAPTTVPSAGRVACFAVSALIQKARARLHRLIRAGDRWRVGVRRLAGPGLRDGGQVPEHGYTWLADDGRRFYADPFVLTHAGRTWVFVEEFPFATGKGVISAVELGSSGPLAAPRPVLEAPYHLSYPYVFAADGEVWMIPETSGARTIELYRAVDFPWRWQRERILIRNVAASDATPLWHQGAVWLFAATASFGGSSWDALSLFTAPDLFGTFVPHPLNPVLVDAGSARPAGRFFHRDGRLMRLAQDCRGGYGAGTAICAVERLDFGGYTQSLDRRFSPPSTWNATGFHTIDEGGGFEVVDCCAAFQPAGAPESKAAARLD